MVETSKAFLEQARFNMIQQQIRPWDVIDRRVLQVMVETPREEFVPEDYRELAFADIEIPLAHGQRMMAPRVEARMLQALDARPGDRVLEVGTGSGYVTACLARLARHVVSVEIEAELAEQASARLREIGAYNVRVRNEDALAGPTEGGPFDTIAVTGSLPRDEQIDLFARQLSVGGRLFVVVGEPPVMEAMLITRVGKDQFRREPLFETELAPLCAAQVPPPFVF